MLETQRIAYLEALGISQYVALATVEGALQLPVLESVAVSVAPTEVAPVAGDNGEQPDAVSLEIQQPIAPAIGSPAPVVVDSDAACSPRDELSSAGSGIPELDLSRLGLQSTTNNRPKAELTVPKLKAFSCLALNSGSGFRILLQLSNADAPGPTAAEHRILSDLLCALGVSDIADQRATRLYRWPVINNPRMATDPIAAKEAIVAFLAAADAVSHTLIMGRQIGMASGLAEGGGVQTMAGLPGQFLVVPGFAEMQMDWKIKAEAWQRINAFLSETV